MRWSPAPTLVSSSSRWFFQRDLPAEWQWISLAVGVLALAVAVAALPTVLDMFWGAPRLRLEFKKWENAEKNRPVLGGRVSNDKVTNRALRLMRVSRKDATISVAFQVYEAPSHRLIQDWTFPTIGFADHEPRKVITIPASWRAGEFGIVGMNELGQANIVQNGGVLPANAYAVSIEIEGTARRWNAACGFVIGQQPGELYWLKGTEQPLR